MAVTRRPRKTQAGAGNVGLRDEAAIRAVIERGGTVAGEGRPDEPARRLVQLRLPLALIDRIDGARRTHAVPPSRHHWLLEAICEKLAREEADDAGG